MAPGPVHIIKSYARDDLTVIDNVVDDEELVLSPDYVIANSRKNEDRLLYPEEEIIYSIKKGDVVLSVIRKIE
jgi:hypothetical protein